ncbi:hypothetical protein RJI07_08705 [Mycoplasmatota bacterium WC30]
MLDFLVKFMLFAFWISFIGLGTLLFLMRLSIVCKDKLSLKTALFVILTPCSIGYYINYKEKSLFKNIYEILVIIEFVLMLIGSVMIIYVRYM